MRAIGNKSGEVVLHSKASGELLKQGAAFNESLQALFPSGRTGYIPKGLYLFKTHEEANAHQDNCLAMHMAQLSLKAGHSNG